MTIGELKQMINGIDDNVEVFTIINTIDYEDSLYDTAANMEFQSLDMANEQGWVEVLCVPKSLNK